VRLKKAKRETRKSRLVVGPRPKLMGGSKARAAKLVATCDWFAKVANLVRKFQMAESVVEAGSAANGHPPRPDRVADTHPNLLSSARLERITGGRTWRCATSVTGTCLSSFRAIIRSMQLRASANAASGRGQAKPSSARSIGLLCDQSAGTEHPIAPGRSHRPQFRNPSKLLLSNSQNLRAKNKYASARESVRRSTQGLEKI